MLLRVRYFGTCNAAVHVFEPINDGVLDFNSIVKEEKKPPNAYHEMRPFPTRRYISAVLNANLEEVC